MLAKRAKREDWKTKLLRQTLAANLYSVQRSLLRGPTRLDKLNAEPCSGKITYQAS